MKRIDITTTQKVVIQYELASLRERIIAFIIDTIILYSLLSLLLYLLFEVLNIQSRGFETAGYIMLVMPVFLFYNLTSEVMMNGQTLGKKAAGIKVVKLTGRAPALSDYLTRWVFRPIDIYVSFGAVAYLLISSSPRSQKLGDLLSNTVVVKVRPEKSLHLSEILKLPSRDNFVPRHPGVTRFNDQQMLAIRELLSRSSKYRNSAHQELLRDTALEISQTLGENTPALEGKYLQEVLEDYIRLTR